MFSYPKTVYSVRKKDIKKVNKFCEGYSDLCLQIKDLTKTKDVANKGIKKYCSCNGIFQTDKFLINISEIDCKDRLDTTLAESFMKMKYPKIWKELCEVAMVQGSSYLRLDSVDEIQ